MIDIENLKKELSKDLLISTIIEAIQATQNDIKAKIRILNQEELQLQRTLSSNNRKQSLLKFLEFWETSATPIDDALVLKSEIGGNFYTIVQFPINSNQVSNFLDDYPTIQGVDISTEYTGENDEGSEQGVVTNARFGLKVLAQYKPLDYECEEYLDVMTAYKVFEKMGVVSL